MRGDATRALLRDHIREFGACFALEAAAELVRIGWTIVLGAEAPEGAVRMRPPRGMA